MRLYSSHYPQSGLPDVGKVIIWMICQVVGLGIEGIVSGCPLEFQVEVAECAVGVSLACLGMVELTFAVFEGEVPLC